MNENIFTYLLSHSQSSFILQVHAYHNFIAFSLPLAYFT